MENRSLDEFLSAEDADDDDADGETDSAPSGEADAVEPIAPTCHWLPGGGPCSSCGAVVEERWHDGDALVCADCKRW